MVQRSLFTRALTWLFIGCLAAGAVTLETTPAMAEEAVDEVYFPETGHHVSSLFFDTWRAWGGLVIVGFPISEPIQENGWTVQYFERARLEHHPEAAGSGWEVQGTLLGRWVATGRGDGPFGPVAPPAEPDTSLARYFPETSQIVANGFLRFWSANGGLPTFGYPISQEFTEDGRIVQYFERARFEWWPEHAGTPWEVQLSLLGVEFAASLGIDTAPVERRPGVPDYTEAGPRSFDLPVLMYHRFGEPESRYQMSWWRFEQQLDWLQANGYTTITLGQAYDALLNGVPLPPKPVVLTFDDGWGEHWEISQSLTQRGMVGVFFITTEQTPLSSGQLRAMADQGHEIGGHTCLHPALPGLDDATLWREVAECRQWLIEASGQPVDFFAYPYGEYDQRVIDTVRAAGYRGAVAAWGGSWWTPDLRWTAPRIEIAGTLSLEEFAAFVE
jgi:peptidoglycan/xylan/chitin deacetylase (PgdA/CDA1 family)